MTASTDDFFCRRLDQLIGLRHSLAVLANRMPWQEIEASLAHHLTALSQAVQETLGHSVAKAARLIAQTRSHKAKDKQPKLYRWHAPEVECISKGARAAAPMSSA